MKKIFILPIFLLVFVIGGCSDSNDPVAPETNNTVVIVVNDFMITKSDKFYKDIALDSYWDCRVWTFTAGKYIANQSIVIDSFGIANRKPIKASVLNNIGKKANVYLVGSDSVDIGMILYRYLESEEFVFVGAKRYSVSEIRDLVGKGRQAIILPTELDTTLFGTTEIELHFTIEKW
jgi:hypothetical protein